MIISAIATEHAEKATDGDCLILPDECGIHRTMVCGRVADLGLLKSIRADSWGGYT